MSVIIITRCECALQGDRNNVVYGSLYRMDLAAYSRHDPLKTAAGAKPRFGYAYGHRCLPRHPSHDITPLRTALAQCSPGYVFNAHLQTSVLSSRRLPDRSQETDGQSQRGSAGRRQRYFLAKQVRKEHDGGVPRIRYRLIARVRWQMMGVHSSTGNCAVSLCVCCRCLRLQSTCRCKRTGYQSLHDLGPRCVTAQDVSGGRGGSLALPPPVLLPLQADGSSTMRRAPASLSIEQLQELQRRRQQQQQQQQRWQQQQAEQRRQQVQQQDQQGQHAPLITYSRHRIALNTVLYYPPCHVCSMLMALRSCILQSRQRLQTWSRRARRRRHT